VYTRSDVTQASEPSALIADVSGTTLEESGKTTTPLILGFFEGFAVLEARTTPTTSPSRTSWGTSRASPTTSPTLAAGRSRCSSRWLIEIDRGHWSKPWNWPSTTPGAFDRGSEIESTTPTRIIRFWVQFSRPPPACPSNSCWTSASRDRWDSNAHRCSLVSGQRNIMNSRQSPGKKSFSAPPKLWRASVPMGPLWPVPPTL